jgi:hypothetical protein
MSLGSLFLLTKSKARPCPLLRRQSEAVWKGGRGSQGSCGSLQEVMLPSHLCGADPGNPRQSRGSTPCTTHKTNRIMVGSFLNSSIQLGLKCFSSIPGLWRETLMVVGSSELIDDLETERWRLEDQALTALLRTIGSKIMWSTIFPNPCYKGMPELNAT